MLAPRLVGTADLRAAGGARMTGIGGPAFCDVASWKGKILHTPITLEVAQAHYHIARGVTSQIVFDGQKL